MNIKRILPLALILALAPAAWPAGEMSESERQTREILNDHIIAIDVDGLAIEPYDLLNKRSGLVRRKTQLQTGLTEPSNKKDPTSARVPKPEARTALLHAGFTKSDAEERLRAALGRQRDASLAFVFAGHVIPRMLAKANESKKPIVIFIHGGMNDLHDATDRATRLIEPMLADGVYPVFICWNSNFFSSWGEHWFYNRNGENFRKGGDQFWAYLTAPVYIATDLAASAVRAPRTVLDNAFSAVRSHPTLQYNYEGVRDANERYYALREAAIAKRPGTPGREGHESREMGATKKAIDARRGDDFDMQGRADKYTERWGAAQAKNPAWQPMEVSKGEYDPAKLDHYARGAEWAVSLPLKGTALAILEGSGTGIWQAMTRRARAMLHYERSYAPKLTDRDDHRRGSLGYTEVDRDLWPSDSTAIGALAVFLRALEKHPHPHGTIAFGHSMGAIILCEALSNFPRVKFDEIVFMAAACSTRDVQASVLPYLKQPQNSRTQFYNVCLHPRADDREMMLTQPVLGQFVPRGSLLVWIDGFLNKPAMFTERTFGYFDTAMLASRTVHPSLQSRVHMVALGGDDTHEQLRHHGAFSSARFWQCAFYRQPGWVPRWDPKQKKGEQKLRVSLKEFPPTGPNTYGAAFAARKKPAR